MKPLNIRKVNIGSLENTKFANIDDYWDDEIIGKIIDLLHEFQYMFPSKFSKMKGIVRDLGNMNIPLKLDANKVEKRLCRLNLRYK